MSVTSMLRRASLACRALCLALLFLLSAALFSVPANAQSVPKIQRGTTGQALVTSRSEPTTSSPVMSTDPSLVGKCFHYHIYLPGGGDIDSYTPVNGWLVEADSKVTVSPNAYNGSYSGYCSKILRVRSSSDAGSFQTIYFSFEVVDYPVPNNVPSPPPDGGSGGGTPPPPPPTTPPSPHEKAPSDNGSDPSAPKKSAPHCPEEGGLNSGCEGSGPTADPVNLSDGSQRYEPASDLRSYNSNGVDANWQRAFSSTQAASGYGTPGLARGWVSNYDLSVTGAANA